MSEKVATVESLFDWFRDRVVEAQQETALRLSDDASLYLASLLTDRARTDRPAPPEETLAELHASAALGPPARQIQQYRELGDRALYLLGYFRENVARRIVGESYYLDMGSAAYQRVDQVFKRWFADAFGPVFAELAERFAACVTLLEHIRARQEAQPDLLTRLYAEWVETGSEDTATRLRSLGLVVPRTRIDA